MTAVTKGGLTLVVHNNVYKDGVVNLLKVGKEQNTCTKYRVTV